MATSIKKKLRILVIPLNSHGHINACHGLCDELRDRGHQVIFLLDQDFAGRLSRYGFEEQYIEAPPKPDDFDQDVEFWQGFVLKHREKYALDPVEQMRQLVPIIYQTMFDHQKVVEPQYGQMIAKIRPDMIINDCYIACPAIIQSGVPWCWLFSAAPHALIQDPRFPPFHSGLPSNGNKEEWRKFRQVTMESLFPILDQLNDYCVQKGMSPLNNRLHPLSPYLNLYMWPKEMRYLGMEELPKNIMGVDCFVRLLPEQKQFQVPESLQNLPGKLIFFSMGSFCCSNSQLMKRMVDMLAESKNRFLVVKGPFNYDLPSNMYGEAFLPQTAILPIVDLVITHGGNNTLTETCFYGKKMLVLPAFNDQFDNAQRVAECGFGARLNPFECSKEELLKTIQLLLDDDHLTKRMAKIGERIRNNNDKQLVADYIEKNIFNIDSS